MVERAPLTLPLVINNKDNLLLLLFIKDEAALREKEKVMNKAGDVFEQLKKADEEDKEAYAAAQRKVQAVSAGLLSSDDGQEATIQDQLMSKSRPSRVVVQ